VTTCPHAWVCLPTGTACGMFYALFRCTLCGIQQVVYAWR